MPSALGLVVSAFGGTEDDWEEPNICVLVIKALWPALFHHQSNILISCSQIIGISLLLKTNAGKNICPSDCVEHVRKIDKLM